MAERCRFAFEKQPLSLPEFPVPPGYDLDGYFESVAREGFAARWRELRTWAPSATLAIGWLLPVVFLLAFNKLTVGTTTGYDTTNESTGFTYKTFMNKWNDTLTQLYNQGLYFILPVGLVGLVMALRWSWRAALLLLLWFVPGTLLYMAYYYGRGMPLIGYLRFFTSMLPAAVVAAVWLGHKATCNAASAARARSGGDVARPRRGAGAVGAGRRIGPSAGRPRVRPAIPPPADEHQAS